MDPGTISSSLDGQLGISWYRYIGGPLVFSVEALNYRLRLVGGTTTGPELGLAKP